jgi:NAD(P)-dependent dehydrogenase (short-subunit alcohol dehydrogenase family)
MANDYLEELFGLAGQVAVVTGGTGALGGALCQGLARAGAHVIVAGRNQERGEARVELIAGAGGKASFLPVEVADRKSVQGLLDATLTSHGRVDILINGAGVNSASSYLEVTDEDWDYVIDNDLTSVHLGCQIFGRHMVERCQSNPGDRGAILNIASVTAAIPLSRVFAYSASKAAVVSLTQNVAREFAPHNVRVNALCPGFFPAEQNRKILDTERTANIMRQTPMARFGSPEELVGAALLLLSRTAGSFITGASYYVDGGFTAMRF